MNKTEGELQTIHSQLISEQHNPSWILWRGFVEIFALSPSLDSIIWQVLPSRLSFWRKQELLIRPPMKETSIFFIRFAFSYFCWVFLTHSRDEITRFSTVATFNNYQFPCLPGLQIKSSSQYVILHCLGAVNTKGRIQFLPCFLSPDHKRCHCRGEAGVEPSRRGSVPLAAKFWEKFRW